jgi:hypothetical protein
MRFHKFISAILHPIVMPTIGVLSYFLVIPHSTNSLQRQFFLGVIFVGTYLVPFAILAILKGFKLIHSFQLATSKERKIPLFIMILLFTILGGIFIKLTQFKDFGLFFYGISFGLMLAYLFSKFRVKINLHLLAMGSMVGFFMMMGIEYMISMIPLLLFLFAISGLLASSRLHLKTDTPKEIYFGFFVGLIAQISAYAFL